METGIEQKIIEAKCTDCKRILHKSPERPITKYDWKCDGCGNSHKVRPGFDFYSCKNCRMDWCNNCFSYIEEEKIIKK